MNAKQGNFWKWEVLAIVLAGATWLATPARAEVAEVAAPAAAVEPQAEETPAPPQLADEITRRLRRMGINIIKTRLDHPYDPQGEVC